MEDFNYDTLSGGALDGIARQEQTSTARAAFAALTFQMLENLELGAGLRLSSDAKDYTAWRDQAPAVIGAGPLGPIHKNPEDTVWSGDMSLRYQVAPSVQTYLRASRGFRAPSIQGRLLFGDAVTVADTETILSFEGGTKLRFVGPAVAPEYSGVPVLYAGSAADCRGWRNQFQSVSER